MSNEAGVCRVCRKEVSLTAPVCPHCQAPRPARAEFTGEGYEWRSPASWLGAPVIHIAFGMDAEGRPRIARGLLAIGQTARGGVAIGLVATGGVAIGIVAVGVVSLGVVAIAALGAVGVNAVAFFSFGVTALGYRAGGLTAWDWRTFFPKP